MVNEPSVFKPLKFYCTLNSFIIRMAELHSLKVNQFTLYSCFTCLGFVSIFQSALRRLHTFVTTSVLESHVGGRFAANLVRAAAKVGFIKIMARKQTYVFICSLQSSLDISNI